MVHPLNTSRLRADYPRSFAAMNGLQPYGNTKARLFPDDGGSMLRSAVTFIVIDSDPINPRLLPHALTVVEMLSPECAKQLAPKLRASQERLSGQSRCVQRFEKTMENRDRISFLFLS